MSCTKVFICGRSTDVNRMLSAYFGAKVELAKRESGAPYLKGSDYFVSLSHKRKILVVAVSPANVGVDIELVEKRPTVFKIAEKYFTEKVEDGDYRKFFSLWTRKESYCKMFGQGLSKSVLATDLSADEIEIENGVVRFVSYDFDDYIVTVASTVGEIEFIEKIDAKKYLLRRK